MQGNVLARLRSTQPSLSPVLLQIGDYVLKEPAKVVYQTITEVADNSGASEASVLRFCRDLGFSSFQRFKLELGIEMSANQTGLPANPTGDIAEDILATAITALHQTKNLLDRSALDTVTKQLVKARSIDIFGFGGSANVARYAHYRLIRLGLKSRLFEDPHLAVMSAVELGPKEVAVGVSESGMSKDTVESLKKAKHVGAFTIAITNHMRSPVATVADVVLVASSTETLFTGGEMPTVVGQVMIIDILAALILKSNKKFEAVNQRTAGAGLAAAY